MVLTVSVALARKRPGEGGEGHWTVVVVMVVVIVVVVVVVIVVDGAIGALNYKRTLGHTNHVRHLRQGYAISRHDYRHH